MDGWTLAGALQALRAIPPHWYYLFLLAAFIAEGTSFPLIAIPSAVMFLASAELIAAGKVSYLAAVLVATVGSAMGGFLTYWLGTRLSRRSPAGSPDSGLTGSLTERARRHWGDPARTARVMRWVGRYGALLALVSRWLGVLRPPALLGTGLARVSVWKVVPALLAGSFLYCAVYQALAVELRTFSFRLLRSLEPHEVALTVGGLALAWLAAIIVFRRVRL